MEVRGVRKMIKIKYPLVFALLLTILLFLVGCNSNNKIIKTIPSPNGKYVAYAFVRDLGATTKESYQMSILKENEKLGNGSGNTFVSYSNFAAVWDNDNEITIKYPKNAEVFKNEVNVKGIKVNYNNQK